VRDITLQVGDAERFLEDVGSVSAAGEGAHGCQVARVAALGLDNEHAGLGARRRLLDTAADLHRRRRPFCNEFCYFLNKKHQVNFPD